MYKLSIVIISIFVYNSMYLNNDCKEWFNLSKNLLREWTKQAYGLLDSVYNAERVEILNNTILELSKIGITDLTLYRVEEDGVTVRYNKRGSKSFKKIILFL